MRLANFSHEHVTSCSAVLNGPLVRGVTKVKNLYRGTPVSLNLLNQSGVEAYFVGRVTRAETNQSHLAFYLPQQDKLLYSPADQTTIIGSDTSSIGTFLPQIFTDSINGPTNGRCFPHAISRCFHIIEPLNSYRVPASFRADPQGFLNMLNGMDRTALTRADQTAFLLDLAHRENFKVEVTSDELSAELEVGIGGIGILSYNNHAAVLFSVVRLRDGERVYFVSRRALV